VSRTRVEVVLRRRRRARLEQERRLRRMLWARLDENAAVRQFRLESLNDSCTQRERRRRTQDFRLGERVRLATELQRTVQREHWRRLADARKDAVQEGIAQTVLSRHLGLPLFERLSSGLLTSADPPDLLRLLAALVADRYSAAWVLLEEAAVAAWLPRAGGSQARAKGNQARAEGNQARAEGSAAREAVPLVVCPRADAELRLIRQLGQACPDGEWRVGEGTSGPRLRVRSARLALRRDGRVTLALPGASLSLQRLPPGSAGYEELSRASIEVPWTGTGPAGYGRAGRVLRVAAPDLLAARQPAAVASGLLLAARTLSWLQPRDAAGRRLPAHREPQSNPAADATWGDATVRLSAPTRARTGA